MPALTHLAQVGPGLEALGYLLLKNRDNLGEDAARRAHLRQRLDRIASDVSYVVPFDAAQWAETMTGAYIAIEHANRELPSELELLNCWLESVVAIRAWVALDLGVKPAALKSRLRDDPTAARFEGKK